MDDEHERPVKPRYRWPWFVLAAVLLGVVLSVLWMAHAVRRTREQRDPNPLRSARAPEMRNETESPCCPSLS